MSKNTGRPVVCIYGSKPWNYPMVQRSVHLAAGFVKMGCFVFYIGRYPEQNYLNGFHRTNDGCYLTYRKDLIRKLMPGSIHILPSVCIDFYFSFINDLATNSIVIYDYIDAMEKEILQYEITPGLAEKHISILQNKDIYVSASSDYLFDDAKKYRGNRLGLVPNACDYSKFQLNGESTVPPVINKFKHTGKVILGFCGTIAAWLDFDLIKYLAGSGENFQIILFGTVGDNSIYNNGLHKQKNVSVIKPVKYDDLHLYLHGFDVALVPFRQCNAAKAASPLKLFEYMAAGVPVVSTDLPECRKYKNILIGRTYSEFLMQVKFAAALKNDLKYINELKKDAMDNTWHERVNELLCLVNPEALN